MRYSVMRPISEEEHLRYKNDHKYKLLVERTLANDLAQNILNHLEIEERDDFEIGRVLTIHANVFTDEGLWRHVNREVANAISRGESIIKLIEEER